MKERYNLKQELLLEERAKPDKLSEAFRLAIKELKQIVGFVGYRARKEACAIGVLGYYFGNASGEANNWPDCDNEKIMKDYDIFERHLLSVYGRGCILLNNCYGWSFERFAEEAEKIGL